MTTYFGPFHHLRLRVTSAASQHIDPDAAGILCFGFPSHDGNPPLIVIWDEDINDGASVTNSIETVLRYLAHEWAGKVEVMSALVVERDSAGDFDHAMPDWTSVTALTLRRVPLVNWQPLKWPNAAHRSQEAFVAMFGPRAQAVIRAITSTVVVRQP